MDFPKVLAPKLSILEQKLVVGVASLIVGLFLVPSTSWQVREVITKRSAVAVVKSLKDEIVKLVVDAAASIAVGRLSTFRMDGPCLCTKVLVRPWWR